MVSEQRMRTVEREAMKKNEPAPFRVGDRIRVYITIREGDKERLQLFAGTVIARKHGGARETFTVRRVSHGVGVEKIFPLHSPHIVRLEIERRARVRRAKLYYLRRPKGKRVKLEEKTKEAQPAGDTPVAGV